MVPPIKYLYTLAFLTSLAYGAPVNEAGSPTFKRGNRDLSVRSLSISFPSAPGATVAPASDDPNYQAYPPDTSGPAEPIRGNLGASIIGAQNIPIQQQNPDVVASPSTDSGDVYVIRYSVYVLWRSDSVYSWRSGRMQSGRLH